MTGRPNQMLRSSQRAREVAEYQSRNAERTAQALRNAEARLEGYVASRRKEAIKESDIAWREDGWMA